jgi:hypothetical protein
VRNGNVFLCVFDQFFSCRTSQNDLVRQRRINRSPSSTNMICQERLKFTKFYSSNLPTIGKFYVTRKEVRNKDVFYVYLISFFLSDKSERSNGTKKNRSISLVNKYDLCDLSR